MRKHAYIRVHVQPKRFPAAYAVDWKVGLHADAPALPITLSTQSLAALLMLVLVVLPTLSAGEFNQVCCMNCRT